MPGRAAANCACATRQGSRITGELYRAEACLTGRAATTPPRHMMALRSATRCCVDTPARSRSFREPAVQARRTGTAAPGCRSRRSDQISSPTIRHAEFLGGHSNAEPFSGSLAMKGSIPGSVARGSNTWNSEAPALGYARKCGSSPILWWIARREGLTAPLVNHVAVPTGSHPHGAQMTIVGRRLRR